jgi:HEPN superfamily Swt1-like protein
MDLLKQGLGPFVSLQFGKTYKERAQAEAKRFLEAKRFRGDVRPLPSKPIIQWDTAGLLKLLWEAWNDVFRSVLDPAERGLVRELLDVRNKWAHQEPFSSDDAFRAADSALRLLRAVSSPQAKELEEIRRNLLHLLLEEQESRVERKATDAPAKRSAASAVKPSHDAAKPNPDKEARVGLDRCEWIYFAVPSRGCGSDALRDFVTNERVIVAHVYNKHDPPIRMPLVQYLQAGQRILLVYGGDGKPYHALLCCTIGAPAQPLVHGAHYFAAFQKIDKSLYANLEKNRYERDPVIGEFTGISISKLDAPDITGPIQKPKGINTLWRWDKVFP